MAISQDFLLRGTGMGLSSLNAAVSSGLTDSQIQNATGVTNLAATIANLPASLGSSPYALAQAARALVFSYNAGIITDSIVQGWTGAANARLTFTGNVPDLPANTISMLQ